MRKNSLSLHEFTMDTEDSETLVDAFEFFGRSGGEREVLSHAIEIMGSQHCARAWLRTESAQLGEKSPQSYASTRAGQKRVLALLGAIANGYEI